MRSPSPETVADRREGGFTVVEIIITVALISIVMVPILNTLVRANETSRFSYDRNQAIDDLRLMMNDVARDVRQASAVTAWSGCVDTPERMCESITVSTYVNSVPTSVTWRAVISGSETQVERVAGSADPRIYVVELADRSDLTPARQIFSFDGTTTLADVRRVVVALATRPDIRHPAVELTTEMELRNAS